MKTPRTLIAFAYVADQFTRTNDIAAGLIPLFAPLISARAGKRFEPQQFAVDVKKTYDLDMHPYVAEELAGALAAHGYLEEERRYGTHVGYTNKEIKLPEPPISESQLTALTTHFIAFAREHLARAGLSAVDQDLQDALFDRLVKPDFLALILRPDGQSLGPRTMTLDKKQQAPTVENRDDAHYDFLVARFILELHKSNAPEFEILVAATSGSLVTEVILDLQHPPKPGESFAGVQIAVDSPLVLDALGLGLERATDYANQLLSQLKAAGAAPVAFESTLEEIRRVLRSTMQNYDRKHDLHGPLGRRLSTNPSLAAYVRTILPSIRSEVEALGVAVHPFSSGNRAERRKYFTESNENELGGRLGEYPTEEARQHDAQVVADILRIRGDNKPISLKEAKIIFVTRNARLARLSRQFLTSEALAARDYFPPCITDRYMAGLLWITSGGGGDSLSRMRLIANCTAAIVPRRDIVSRLHKFLESLSPKLVTRFEALMTNERAEHFLMDRTLADTSLITEENYESILREIEDQAAERVEKKKNEEIASLRVTHEQQVAGLRSEAEERREQLRQESTRAALLESELHDTKAVEESERQRANAISAALLDANIRWAKAGLKTGLAREIRLRLLVILAIEIVGAGIAQASSERSDVRLMVLLVGLGVSLFTALLAEKLWPENPIEKWIENQRFVACKTFLTRHDVSQLANEFEFDWKDRKVRPK
jgi:hypothetical protein